MITSYDDIRQDFEVDSVDYRQRTLKLIAWITDNSTVFSLRLYWNIRFPDALPDKTGVSSKLNK